MTLQACAEIVRDGDPDRFLAAMAAPAPARAVLFPLYAFNVEIARAPHVTREELIARMRLQWWRDALGEIAGGGVVRRHEVTLPLAQAVTRAQAATLSEMVDAREWEVAPEGFADGAALMAHLEASAAPMMRVAAEALGAEDAAQVVPVARAGALANWLMAVPALEADGVPALPEGLDLAALAGQVRAEARAVRLSRPARIAARSAWRAQALLGVVARDPEAVRGNRLVQSEFARRGSLMWRAALGR